MTTVCENPTTYRAVDLRNIAATPQWERLDGDMREAIEVVGQVLPFRTNQYVLDNLIDWSRVPDDPIFQLVFPQRPMITAEDYGAVRSLLDEGVPRNVLREENQPHPPDTQSPSGGADDPQRPDA